jgi:hypothetical protein
MGSRGQQGKTCPQEAQELGEHVLSLFHRKGDLRWLNDIRDDLLGTTRYLDTQGEGLAGSFGRISYPYSDLMGRDGRQSQNRALIASYSIA